MLLPFTIPTKVGEIALLGQLLQEGMRLGGTPTSGRGMGSWVMRHLLVFVFEDFLSSISSVTLKTRCA